MKKSFVFLGLFLATLWVSPIAKADQPPPICGPNGCQKPGLRLVLQTPADQPPPICGPNGCSKPGVALQ